MELALSYGPVMAAAINVGRFYAMVKFLVLMVNV
jgi:hypothetical protein